MSDEISFPANLEKQLANPYLPTYQVNDISFAPTMSNMAPDNKAAIRAILASSFSNQYAAKYSDRIVLPSPFSGTRWKKAVIQHITGGLINSGEYASEQEESADVPIKLLVDAFDADMSQANEYSVMLDFNIGVGLSAYEGAKEKQIAATRSVTIYRIPKDLNHQYEYNFWGIFNDAAIELGQKLKKK